MSLNLYYLSQNDQRGYDTYDSCIVAAESEEAARLIHPGVEDFDWKDTRFGMGGTWARYPNLVKVEFIGVAASSVKPGVVLASFNAG